MRHRNSPPPAAETDTDGRDPSRRATRLGDAPRWLWLWFPIASIAVMFAVRDLGKDIYDRVMATEQGVVENGTVVILLIAIAAGVLAFRRRRSLPNRWLGRWLLLVTVGCAYIAIEEVSWGQHLVGWETPASIGAINDQGQTNLHNISSWFDQKPRLIVELGILVGGVIFPLWALLTGFAPDPNRDWRYWFWPTFACLPAAVVVATAKFPKRFDKWFDWPRPPPLDIGLSEVHEYFIATVLMVYLWSFYLRLRQFETRGQGGGALSSTGTAAKAMGPCDSSS